MLSHSIAPDSLQPYGLYSPGSFCPWHYPGKNSGVVATSSPRGCSRPRDQTCDSCSPCISRQFLYHLESLPVMVNDTNLDYRILEGRNNISDSVFSFFFGTLVPQSTCGENTLFLSTLKKCSTLSSA